MSICEIKVGDQAVSVRLLSKDPLDAKTESVPWFSARDLMAVAGVDGRVSDVFRTSGTKALNYAQHSREEKPNRTVFVSSALAARFLARHPDELAELLSAVATQLTEPFAAKKQPPTLARQVGEQLDDALAATLVSKLNHDQRVSLRTALDEQKLGCTSGYIGKGTAAKQEAISTVWHAMVETFCHRKDVPALLAGPSSQSTDGSELSQPVASQQRVELEAAAVSALDASISADLEAGAGDLIIQKAPLLKLLLRRWHAQNPSDFPRTVLQILFPGIQLRLDEAATLWRAVLQCSDMQYNGVIRPPYQAIASQLGLEIAPPSSRLEDGLWAAQTGLSFLTTANWSLELVPKMPLHVINSARLPLGTATTPVSLRS
jgi:hypothetical protein